MRDSAGVRIIENVAKTWTDAEAWRVASNPNLTIGELDGTQEYQLFRVASALRLDDGRLVVANSGTQEIRFYDAAGSFLAATGRRGQGPGEFVALSWVRRFGDDSLIAYDPRLLRLTLLDTDGRFGRTIALTATGGPTAGRVTGVFDDGSLLVIETAIFQGPPPNGYYRVLAPLWHYSNTGEPQDSLGATAGRELFFTPLPPSFAVWTLPFARTSQVLTEGGRYYVAETDRYEIAAFTPDGALTRLIRKRHDNLPVTSRELEAHVQATFADESDDNVVRNFRAALEDMPVPETMPAYASVVVDRDRNLWVQDYTRAGDDTSHWTVFDGEGRIRGELDLPPGLRVLEIGADYVLGLATDDLDVERILQYPLLKGGGGAAPRGR